MGHSFGGWTALWLAVKHPRAVGQMVLEAPGGLRIGAKPLPPPARCRRHAAPALCLSGKGRGPDQAAGGRRRQHARRSAATTAASLVDEELLARLPEIKARTLIVLATKDEMIPAKTGQVLKEKIPLSHLTYMLRRRACHRDRPAGTDAAARHGVPRTRRSLHREFRRRGLSGVTPPPASRSPDRCAARRSPA